MKFLVVFVLCAVTVKASIPDGYDQGRFAFHGRYAEKCGNDGFYYKDDNSFVICSNGNSYEQPCASGSRNSGFGHYTHGNHYYYRDFCDVNLVDSGAGIPHRYAHHDAGYEYGRDGAHGKSDVSGYGYGHGAGHDAAYGHGRDDGSKYENDVAYGKSDVSGSGYGRDRSYGHGREAGY